MHTEASHRFERGADPNGPPVAIARIAHLLEKLGAGDDPPGARRRGPGPGRPSPARAARGAGERGPRDRRAPGAQHRDPRRARLRDDGDRTGRVGGGRADAGAATSPAKRTSSRRWGATTASTRSPRRSRPASAWAASGPAQREERIVRDVLVGAGLTETIQNAFVGGGRGAAATEPVRLANPLADHHSVLRSSLVQPGLLAALETNVRQGRRDVALFEMGRVFSAGGAPAPRGAAAGAAAGRGRRGRGTGRRPRGRSTCSTRRASSSCSSSGWARATWRWTRRDHGPTSSIPARARRSCSGG